MKPYTMIFIVTIGLFNVTSAFAREHVIALSPYQASSSAKVEVTEVLKFLTELDPGDTAFILDGYHLTLIGEWKTPSKASYKSPKARLAVNRQAVAAMMQFANNAKVSDSDAPTVSRALRLPHLLRYVSENYALTPMSDIIILGSPIYEDIDTPELSMLPERFPGDGHLEASAGKTPYSAQGRQELLKDLNVHIHYGADGLPGSERHDYFVKRFWTLFIEKQGGNLMSFANDLPTVLRKVTSGTKAPSHDFKLEPSDKLEMIQLAPVEIEQSIFDRPVQTIPLPKKESRRAEEVEVGITWDCQRCDLDLYAKANPGAKPLYYNNMRSIEGRYWKDYRNSPKTTNGREAIGFKVPLDLRTLQLAINFYRGHAPDGVTGEIRLSVKGQTFAKTFHITEVNGNKGQGVIAILDEGNKGHAHTLIIDPLTIVGTRPLKGES